MRKGAIVLTPFPFTDLSGHKVRPALILVTSKKGEDCIVAFVSSIARKPLAFDVIAPMSDSNGLKADSLIRVDKIATLEKKIFVGTIGMLEPKIMKEVDTKFKTLFQL